MLRQKQLWYHSDFQEIPASCCSLRRKTCLRFNKEEVLQGAGQKSSGKMWKTLNDTTTHHLIILCYLGILWCLTDLHDQRFNQSFDRYLTIIQFDSICISVCKVALDYICSLKKAHEVTLIHGPPWTFSKSSSNESNNTSHVHLIGFDHQCPLQTSVRARSKQTATYKAAKTMRASK